MCPRQVTTEVKPCLALTATHRVRRGLRAEPSERRRSGQGPSRGVAQSLGRLPTQLLSPESGPRSPFEGEGGDACAKQGRKARHRLWRRPWAGLAASLPEGFSQKALWRFRREAVRRCSPRWVLQRRIGNEALRGKGSLASFPDEVECRICGRWSKPAPDAWVVSQAGELPLGKGARGLRRLLRKRKRSVSFFEEA